MGNQRENSQWEKRATIKDIAKATGVSNMAVSLALNQKPGVSAATRERILQAARELHYVPNQMARSLLSNETKTLGVVNSNTSLFVFGSLFRGIERVAAREGYGTLISSTDENCEKEQQAIDILLNKRVDGLLLIAPLNIEEEDMDRIRSFGVPFVYLLRQNGAGINACLNDNVAGGYGLLSHLLETGSRRFLFFSMEDRIRSWRERMQGFGKALEEWNLDPASQQYHLAAPNIRAGYEAMQEELEKGLVADTIVCGCDLIAVGVLKMLTEAGIQVPGQVRLAGYDDIEMAEHVRVPLTTIHQPYEQIGEEGTQLLLEQIRDPERAPRQKILKSHLVLRQSTEG